MKTTFTYLFLGVAFFVKAQDGILDPNFGNGGIKVITNIGVINSAKKSNDNKIYVFGRKKTGANYYDTDCMLARFNMDGTLDAAFGNGGVVLHNYDNQNEAYTYLAFEDGGKLLLNDYYGNIYRLNNDGSKDTSYGTNGVANIIGHYFEKLSGVNNLIASSIFSSGCNYTKVSKISNLGNFDTSFASPNGWLYGGSNCSQTIINKGLVLLDNGAIVTLNQSQNVPFSVQVRGVQSTGVQNATFNTSVASQNLNFSTFAGAGGVFSKQDNIFINADDGNLKYYVVKIKEDGFLDTSFDNDGKLSITIPNTGMLRTTNIQFQEDGKILLFGNYKTGSNSSIYNSQFLMIRILNNGQLDNNFGNQGIVLTPVNGYIYTNPTGIQDSNGNIMIVGNIDYSSDNPNIIAFAKYKNEAVLSSQETTEPALKFYPNPIKSTLNFSQELSDIKITDMSGKVVLQKKEKGNTISVENLPKGNYMITAKANKGTAISEKFIKD